MFVQRQGPLSKFCSCLSLTHFPHDELGLLTRKVLTSSSQTQNPITKQPVLEGYIFNQITHTVAGCHLENQSQWVEIFFFHFTCAFLKLPNFHIY